MCTFKKVLKKTFQTRLKELACWFEKWGYPKRLIDSQITKCFSVPREDSLKVKEREKTEVGIPFVVTFHPGLSRLGSIMYKLLPFLNADHEVKNVFTPKPFPSFRSVRDLRSHVVRSKLYPLERWTGSSRCGNSRCQACNNIVVSQTFESSITGEQFRINHLLNCNNKCVVYLLTCNVCKIQYVQ